MLTEDTVSHTEDETTTARYQSHAKAKKKQYFSLYYFTTLKIGSVSDIIKVLTLCSADECSIFVSFSSLR